MTTYTDKDGDTHETVRSLYEAHNLTFEPQMGGNCTAYSMTHNDGSSHWITIWDGGEAPTEFSEPCAVSFSKDPDDNTDDEVTDCTTAIEALALVFYGDKNANV